MIVDVVTHRRPEETAEALTELLGFVVAHGAQLSLGPEEQAKHPGLRGEGVLLRGGDAAGGDPGGDPGGAAGSDAGAGADVAAADTAAADAAAADADAPAGADVDLCIALGGDGTVLGGLRAYAGTGVPVFGINFGEMGFLTVVDRDQRREGFRRALGGDFEVLSLPAIEASGARGRWLAVNDISMHRQPGKRVADLEYSVGSDEVGRVRCDGLVVATPAGSTGYNLANGGPVMAWGVAGYVVSFIAPHSFTARTLVVAPTDPVSIDNRSRDEPVDVTVDGRPVCTLEAGERLHTRFLADQGSLAQLPGATFYGRLREKFGRLAVPM